MVGALASYSPPGVEVPHIKVFRWSPYSSVRLVVLGVLAPPEGVPITLHYFSPDRALDVTVVHG